MPNIKISGLPLAILPLDEATTLFEVTVLEAGEEVSRQLSADNLFGGFGLDATFVTVTANAGLPNERVLTPALGLTLVDGGAGGPVTISMPIGSANDLLFFSGGVWAATAGLLIWNGTTLALADNRKLSIRQGGASDNPFLLIGNFGDTGFYAPDSDGTVRFTSEEFDAIDFTGSGIKIIGFGTSSGPALRFTALSFTEPTIKVRHDFNHGLASGADNVVSIIAGRVGGSIEGLRFTTSVSNEVLQGPQASVGLTAFAGGGQGSATVIASSINVFSTVASGGDSAKLPAVFEAGTVSTWVFIKNDGAESMDLFPASGQNLGQGVDTALAIPVGTSAVFVGTVANSVWTQLIV